MELKMEVYSPSLILLGILEAYKSVIWEEYAFKAGSFSIDALITEKTVELLSPDNIIWIEGETAGIVEYMHETVDDSGSYISVKGPTLTGLLERRILWGRYSLSGTPERIMRHLVTECAINPTRGETSARVIPGLYLESEHESESATIQKQKTGGSLLEALTEIGEANNMAFGIRFNPAIPRMEFWTRTGINRSAAQEKNDHVFFSTELDDVLSSEYSYDSSGWKNVALVAGEGEGINRSYVTVNA